MMTDVPGLRPAVISAATSDSLDEFRRFRHVVRNIYAEHLDPERIRLLVEKLPNVWSSLDSELTAFAQFLEGTSQADDEMPE